MMYAHPGSIYVPIFVFVLGLAGAVVRLNRRMILLFCFSAFVFMICLGDIMPVHGFLYHQLFFVRMLRNLHFFLWLAYPVLALFLAEQYRLLTANPPVGKRGKIPILLYVVIVHLAFAVFLCRSEGIILSSFWVVGLSLIFFCLYFLGYLRAIVWQGLFLLLIVSLHPLEVFRFMESAVPHSFRYSRDPHSIAASVPQFSFTRPAKPGLWGDMPQGGFGEVTDTSGFMPESQEYIGLKWPYALQDKVPHEIFGQYVRYKFWIYDKVRSPAPDLKLMDNVWTGKSDFAFIEQNPPVFWTAQKGGRPGRPITGDSDQFHVLKFDLNEIIFKTDYGQDQFLVYTDNFESGWSARINGKPVELLRANVAFKGLWLPAGENTVQLSFRQRQDDSYWALLFFVHVFFFYLVGSALAPVLRRKTVG
jgi:hypothetical protein